MSDHSLVTINTRMGDARQILFRTNDVKRRECEWIGVSSPLPRNCLLYCVSVHKLSPVLRELSYQTSGATSDNHQIMQLTDDTFTSHPTLAIRAPVVELNIKTMIFSASNDERRHSAVIDGGAPGIKWNVFSVILF